MAVEPAVKLSGIPVIDSANCHDHVAAPSEKSPRMLKAYDLQSQGAGGARFYLKARAIAFRADYAVFYGHYRVRLRAL